MSQQQNRSDARTTKRPSRSLWQTRSAEKVRAGMKNLFIDRLKQSRHRNVDKLRTVLEKHGDDVDFQSLDHMKKSLQHDHEALDLLMDVDFNILLLEIEKEIAAAMLEEEAMDQDAAVEKEAQDIVERHMIPCNICGNLLEGESLCQVCVNSLSEQITNVNRF